MAVDEFRSLLEIIVVMDHTVEPTFTHDCLDSLNSSPSTDRLRIADVRKHNFAFHARRYEFDSADTIASCSLAAHMASVLRAAQFESEGAMEHLFTKKDRIDAWRRWALLAIDQLDPLVGEGKEHSPETP